MRLDRPAFARSLMTAGITAALGFTTLPALAAANHAHQHGNAAVTAPNAKAAEARQKAFNHTQALMALQKQWANSKGAEKSRALEQLTAKAEERRAHLLELMESNPSAALSAAIPEEKQAGMPAEVLEKLEQKLELEGELTVFHVENGDNSKFRYLLNSDFGDTFELHLAKKHDPDQLPQGRVKAQGVLFPSDNGNTEEHIVLNSDESDALLMAVGGTSSGSTLQAASPALGEQRILVIPVSFQDDPGSQPYTKAQIASTYGYVDGFMQENSYGTASIKADIANWSTIATNSGSCPLTTIADQAKAAAISQGYNPDAYRTHVVVFPRNSACGFSGMGSVGGTPGIAWINGSNKWSLHSHEIGHTFGLFHSNALNCGSQTTGSNCTVSDYGDIMDTMGSGVAGHFNAYQKDRLGWLDGRISTITQDGLYRLSPFAKGGQYPAALKVAKDIDASTGTQNWYYLESRQLLGYDAALSSTNAATGITVHTGNESKGNSSNLLDMTPGSSGGFWDAALPQGATYTDSTAGVSIAANWVDASYSEVEIATGSAPVCTPTPPTLTLSPVSQWAEAGNSVSYNVTLKNNDSSNCGSSSFQLSQQAPSGWSAQLQQSSISLQPGATAVTSLTVTSATSASDGFYDVRVATSHQTSVSDTASYVVESTASNRLPVAVNDSASTTFETPVTIDVLANDSDPDGDRLSVSGTSGANGTVRFNSDGTLTFTPAQGFSGNTSFTYTVTDGQGGSAKATVSISVGAAPSSSNSAPVAVNDSATMATKDAITIAVLSNDWDADGDKLKVITVNEGGKGSVRINADGTLTFTPAKNFKSSDTFSYVISDGKASSTASVSVTLNSSDSSSGNGKGKGPNR